MLKNRTKNKGSLNLGTNQVYEIHFFVPGPGFKALFYPANSKEEALRLLKREYPAAQAFWIAPARGKALAGRQARYLVWWKSYGGPDWEPHMVFVLDSDGALASSVPDFGKADSKSAFDLATKRSSESAGTHRLEEVDESTASLIGNEVLGAQAIEQEQIIKDFNAGKYEGLEAEAEAEGFPDLDWPDSGPSMEGLRDIPLPPRSPRPEMWNLEAVIQAIHDGFTFGLPFVMGESLFTPNAYWIGGQQYSALLLTVGPDHTPEAELNPDGWLRVKLYFEPFMVPQRTWTGPPNSSGVVAVYAEIDPATVDWALLNRDF